MNLATANKPTVAEDAIATADSHLNNAVLPTYTELLEALRTLQGFDNLGAYGRADVRKNARALLGRHDRTLAGDFKG